MKMNLCNSVQTRKNVQNYNIFKGDKFLNLASPGFLLLYSLFLTVIFSCYMLHFPFSPILKFASKQDSAPPTNSLQIINHSQPADYSRSDCDLLNGSWVLEEKGNSLYYTNFSCPTIPHSKNCLLNGRADEEFMQWRWKPEECTLPRFNAKTFLTFVKGKTMAFIGDSLARNHMESLLCILSSEESPTDMYKDVEDKFRTWLFPHHNFTLMVLRTEFLVFATERVINGSFTGGFDLHLDKLNGNWTQHLTNIDYVIFSDGHWFLRPNYLYENGNLIGCVYCGEAGVQDLGPGYAIQRAFQAAFNYINKCVECSGIVVLLRTFSAGQFEQGAWNEGGFCNRTRPFNRHEVKIGDQDWEFRSIQIEEIERARKDGEKNGNMFEIVDVTRAMLMRPDGHPGAYWGNKWMKGYSDCIHWCLPGPIDTWNEFLQEILRRKLPIFH